jgi:hypothetical protein
MALMGLLPNSALKGKAKLLTKLPVDNFAFSFNLVLFLIFESPCLIFAPCGRILPR